MVVLPEPCRPAISTTVGGFDAYVMRIVSPPSVAVSSSLTILMTCCAGLSAPAQLDADAALPDARHDACDDLEVDVGFEQREPDLAQDLVDVGLASCPRPRSRLKIPSKRSDSDSNMKGEGYRLRGSRLDLEQVVDPSDTRDGGGHPDQFLAGRVVRNLAPQLHPALYDGHVGLGQVPRTRRMSELEAHLLGQFGVGQPRALSEARCSLTRRSRPLAGGRAIPAPAR